MAKAKASDSSWQARPKVKRKGIHSKTRRSVHKKGKHYKKTYKGQGR